MSLRLAVRPEARRFVSTTVAARLRRHANRMLLSVARADPSLGPEDRLEVGLTLVGDDEIRELNRAFRRIDKPTDVLAFAMREGTGGMLNPGLLGDVVISAPTARRQRRASFEKELLVLWAHGLCHLLGYDHQTDRQEAKMNARAAALLAEGGRTGQIRPA